MINHNLFTVYNYPQTSKVNYTYNKPWATKNSNKNFPSGEDFGPDGFTNEFYKMFNQTLKTVSDKLGYFKLPKIWNYHSESSH